MQPDIIVVIPAYNEGPRLAQTLESIASTHTTTARMDVAPEAAQLTAAWSATIERQAI